MTIMTQFITTTLTGPSNLVDATTDSNIYITETGSVLATSGSAITASVAIDLRVFGTLAGTGTGLVALNGGTVFVGETGQVSGTNSGIAFSSAGVAEVVNYGTIVGGNTGINSAGVSIYLENHGSITSFGAHGFEATLETGSVNYGSITGDQAIDIFRNDDTTSVVAFDNYGTLTGTSGIAIDGDSTNPDHIFNAGVINGSVDLQAGNNMLTNTATGVVNGSYLVTSGDDTLINDGGIFGDVQTGNGNDVVRNSGLITGDVLLSGDDDTYTAAGDGRVDGVIDGGVGNDTLTGGSNADFMDGGDDNDRLFGRGGDDDLRGGLGSDFMSGGMGDDQLIGDDGSDKMFGGDGDDTLNGGRDKDTIRGGDGDDEIKGGRLADVLNGGAGADTFVYGVKQDSSTGASDVIQDFEVGIDVVDLSGVASGLTFVGTAAFSGTGNEVRYDIAGNGRTFIQVDTDANGTADMRIWLTDVGALSADDFVL
jgi:Ca2+-binding RTX toxin-like protein